MRARKNIGFRQKSVSMTDAWGRARDSTHPSSETDLAPQRHAPVWVGNMIGGRHHAEVDVCATAPHSQTAADCQVTAANAPTKSARSAKRGWTSIYPIALRPSWFTLHG